VVRPAPRPAALPLSFDLVLTDRPGTLGDLLRIAPDPLPRLDVREMDGSIEVFVAEKPPTEPA